jgi:hypothetical protein
MRAGPPNPYNITPGSVLDCTFVEPDPTDPEGGVTPKVKINTANMKLCEIAQSKERTKST